MRTSPELIPGLPIVPPYHDGELIQSHLRRIADANCLSSGQLGRILMGNTSKASKEDSLKLAGLLAEKLGHPVNQVRSWTLLGFLNLDNRKSAKRQICPECLTHEMTQSVHLAEPAYAICPTHGLAHHVKCPACRKELLWGTGRHHFCACGFDLRDSERLKLSADTLELFLACYENRPLGDSQMILSVDLPESKMERLSSALEYLSTICAMEESQNRGVLYPTISSEAQRWEGIGLKVKADPKRLDELVKEIEMRLVYTKTIPGRGVLKPKIIRNAICWDHLRGAVQRAHESAIKLEQTNDIGRIAEVYGLDPQDVFATQLLVNKCISSDFRAEMRSQFNGLKRQRGANPELEARRLAALIDLVQELRSVHELSWLKPLKVEDKVNLLAFIAAGALKPWAAAPFRNWHMLLSDVARLSHLLRGQAFSKMHHGEKKDSYVVKFSQIFNERAAPSDWLGLSSREIGSRVEKLVRASEYPISNPDDMPDRLALPVGFCAFLSGGSITVCGDPQEKGGLEKLALVSETWEAAAQELVQVCLQAQTNFARLDDWQRVAADVAWNYLSDMTAGGSAAEAMKRANAGLTEDGGFSRKAMRLAIEGHAAPSVAHSR